MLPTRFDVFVSLSGLITKLTFLSCAYIYSKEKKNSFETGALVTNITKIIHETKKNIQRYVGLCLKSRNVKGTVE